MRRDEGGRGDSETKHSWPQFSKLRSAKPLRMAKKLCWSCCLSRKCSTAHRLPDEIPNTSLKCLHPLCRGQGFWLICHAEPQIGSRRFGSSNDSSNEKNRNKNMNKVVLCENQPLPRYLTKPYRTLWPHGRLVVNPNKTQRLSDPAWPSIGPDQLAAVNWHLRASESLEG